MWNGIEMRYSDLIGSGKFHEWHDAFSFSNRNGDEIKLAPLMQFTGLLDKNGKEIYEGDILMAEQTIEITIPPSESTSGREYKSNIPNGQKILLQVVFNPSIGAFAFQYIGDKQKQKQNGWQEKRQMEIIGNIYENPELLTNHTGI
jgi:uncharacterized phage protein (TIGR01671 family)